MENLVHELYTSGELREHVKRKHLAHTRESSRIRWEVCLGSIRCTCKPTYGEYTEASRNASIVEYRADCRPDHLDRRVRCAE